jgi:hypothetical protein
MILIASDAMWHVVYKEIRDENQYWRKAMGVFTDFQRAHDVAISFEDGLGDVECFVDEEGEGGVTTGEGNACWALIMYELDPGKTREGVVGIYDNQKHALTGWEKYVARMRDHGYTVEMRICQFCVNDAV